MSVGAWLILLAVLVYLAGQPIKVVNIGRGVLVGCAVIVSLIILAGCERPTVLECKVGSITGTFQTTNHILARPYSGLVKMWRGDRVFYWPVEDVRGCHEPEVLTNDNENT